MNKYASVRPFWIATADALLWKCKLRGALFWSPWLHCACFIH